MKKNKFFTEEFLDKCQEELNVQFRIINYDNPFAHPFELSDQVRDVAKIFYNRILFLLYQGGRISQITFIEQSYMVGDWQMNFTTKLD